MWHGLHTLFQTGDLLRGQDVPTLSEHTWNKQIRTTAQEYTLLCLPVAAVPAACVPLWLTCITQPVCMQTGLQPALCNFDTYSWCLLLQLLLLLLWVWMGSDFEQLTQTQNRMGHKGSQWLEFGAAGLSLTLYKRRLFCSEQNTSVTYHLAYSYSRA